MRVREFDPEELPTVAGLFAGTMLQVSPDQVRGGTTLVAAEDDRVLGALVLDGEEILAVAVRRRRRGQGVGTALVEAAGERRGRLVAEFDPGVRDFYEALGFEVDPAGADGRLRGVRSRP